MKKIICLSVTFICVLTLYAQTPGINYQAVVRDADGTQISNQAISLTIDILESEQVLLREKHELSTDEFGLINTLIGSGIAELGSIEDLIGKKDLAYEISADLNGTEMMIGSGKMGAVPFAFYGADEDADPENELQELSLADAKLSLTGSEGEVDLSKFRSPWIADSTGYTLFLDPDSISEYRERIERPNVRLGLSGGIFSTEGNERSQIFFALGTPNIFQRVFLDTENNEIAEHIQLNENASSNTRYSSNPDLMQVTQDILYEEIGLKNTRQIGNGGEIRFDGGTLGSSDVSYHLDFSQFLLEGTSNDPNRLVITSQGPIDIPSSNSVNSSLSDFHRVELLPTGTKKVTADEECLTERIEVVLDEFSDPPNISVHEFKINDVGEISEIVNGESIENFKSADDIMECNEIPTGGSFSNKVSQNGATAINEGIDGNTRFREILSRDSSASSGDIVFEDEVGALAAISAVASGGAAILNSAGGGSAPPGLSSRNMAAFPNTQHVTEGGLELSLGVNSDFAGNISVLNDGVQNMNIGTLQGIPNAGAIVGYNEGAPKWYLYTQDGVSKLIVDMIQSTLLSPNTDEEIAYGTLAGPEQAVYERGTATLVDGEVFVSCADHFAGVADPGSMTVTVTPLSAESLGLAIVEKSGAGFKVKELYQGKGNYSFDYMVMCKRSDVTYQLKPDLPEADESMKKISDSVRIEYEKAKKSRK